MEELFQPIDTSEGKIFFIAGKEHAKYPYSNSLLIGDTLIDTGISRSYLRKVKESFTIKQVLLSHWHEDHISGNYLLKDLPFYIHPQDKAVVENIKMLYGQYGIVGTPIEEQFIGFLEGLNLRNSSINHTFQDGEILECATPFDLQVIHTPGHSAGHCCFYERKTRIGFLADIDLSSFGPWYGCLDSNLDAFEDSLTKIREFPFDLVVTGHKGLVQGRELIRQKLKDYAAIIPQRDEKILTALFERKPQTAADLTGKCLIYPGYNQFKEYLLIAERIMIDMHFKKLLFHGKILSEEGGFIRK